MTIRKKAKKVTHLQKQSQLKNVQPSVIVIRNVKHSNIKLENGIRYYSHLVKDRVFLSLITMLLPFHRKFKKMSMFGVMQFHCHQCRSRRRYLNTTMLVVSVVRYIKTHSVLKLQMLKNVLHSVMATSCAKPSNTKWVPTIKPPTHSPSVPVSLMSTIMPLLRQQKLPYPEKTASGATSRLNHLLNSPISAHYVL